MHRDASDLGSMILFRTKGTRTFNEHPTWSERASYIAKKFLCNISVLKKIASLANRITVYRYLSRFRWSQMPCFRWSPHPCQAGFTSKGYRCTCLEGCDGERCKKAGASFLFLLIIDFLIVQRQTITSLDTFSYRGFSKNASQWFAAAQILLSDWAREACKPGT